MQTQQIKERIESHLDGSCFVTEFSGGGDHYSVIVVSSNFIGKTSLQKHRMVMDLFKEEINTGEVHALSIQPLTPEQWNQTQKLKHKEES